MAREQEVPLHVFWGLTGSGKSYLGRHWAETHGYCYFNTDVIRKQLAGLDPTTRCLTEHLTGLYSPEMTERTYQALLELAHLANQRCGQAGVVLDGSFLRRRHRQQVWRAFAASTRLVYIYCFCDEELTRRRLGARLTDAKAVSDGHLEIYHRQRASFEPPDEIPPQNLVELDTDGSVEYLSRKLSLRLLA